MRNKPLITWVLMMIVAAVSQAATGVGRMAITLQSGIQEIFCDTMAQRYNYVEAPGTSSGYAVSVMNREGKVLRTIPTDSIVEMNYGELTDYESFAGDWYLVASPSGEPNQVGLMVTSVVSMPYHAVLPAPRTPDYGKYIYCHLDSVAHRKGLKYDADFKLRYSYDEADGRGSVSIILDDQVPVSTARYEGDESTYAYFDGPYTYYFGVHENHAGGDTGGRYMYFVSQNVEKHILEGTELQADWTLEEHREATHEYLFPANRQIYWIVALDIPYSYAEHDELGFIDIFSSVRLMRHAWTKPLQEE